MKLPKRDSVRWCLCLAAFVGMLPGCVKYYELSYKEFPQPCFREDELADAAAEVRSVTIYDQFQTKLIMDALPVLPHVYASLARGHCRRQGKDTATFDAMMTSYRDEMVDSVSFYVLADARDKLHPALIGLQAAWALYLEDDQGHTYPIKLDRDSGKREIKEVDFSPEVVDTFGCFWSRYKVPYRVVFERFIRDKDGAILADVLASMRLTLIARSVDYNGCLCWDAMTMARVNLDGYNVDISSYHLGADGSGACDACCPKVKATRCRGEEAFYRF
jgi:hypothetical protein